MHFCVQKPKSYAISEKFCTVAPFRNSGLALLVSEEESTMLGMGCIELDETPHLPKTLKINICFEKPLHGLGYSKGR